MNEPKKCEICGAAIPEDAPGGACPGCLLGAGLGEAESTPEPFDREELARLLPQFEIESFVGQGGMGVVYRARQKSLDRQVALKILTRDVAADPSFAERFAREARALAALSHPNIVAVYEAGRVEDLWFLTMEYVEGVNLRQAERAGRLSPEQALAIVPQICDALQYAHDEGVVHRDIKPENILLDRKGNVKIADFGLAKLLRSDPANHTLTGTEQVMGTMHYIAPEQMRTPQEVDHRADIYSLGVVFYEMLTGDLPIGRFPMPSEKVEIDVRLDEVVLRTLERERERRYQRVDEVKTSMESIASSPAAPVPPAAGAAAPSPAPAATPSSRLSRLAVAAILCWPLALLAGIIVVALGARDEIGIWAGVSVALTGFILSIIAYHAIKREPDRLHGLKLAKLGFVAPVVLGVLWLVVLLAWAGIYQWQRSIRVEKAQKEKMEQKAVEARARELLSQVAARGGMAPMEDVSALVDPRRRDWFAALSGEEFKRLSDAAELGLAMIDPNVLPAPLADFRVHEVGREGDEAHVTLTKDRHQITYSMVRVDGEWYLAICPLGFRFYEPYSFELQNLRRRLDGLLLNLPKEPTRERMDLLLPAVDPAKHDYLKSLDAGQYAKLKKARELGAAFLAASEIPGGSWHLASSPSDIDTKQGRGTYTLWGLNRSFRITAPIVRTNGRWYFGVGKVEIVEVR